MVAEQSAPRAAKSADKMEGAMMAGGDIAASLEVKSSGASDIRGELVIGRVGYHSSVTG